MIESWKMHSLLATVILLFVGTGLAQEQVGRKLYPVDESHLDPSFAEFKAKLLRAIETQDRAFLSSALSQGVTMVFQEGIPADRIMAVFDENNGALWQITHRLLGMGVKHQASGRFFAPYVFDAIVRAKDFDPFTNMVITDEDVDVYAEPKPDASVMASLSYDIVEFDRRESSWDLSEGWFKITVLDGQTGYVRAKYGYTTDSERVVFAKQDGEWKLVRMLGGD